MKRWIRLLLLLLVAGIALPAWSAGLIVVWEPPPPLVPPERPWPPPQPVPPPRPWPPPHRHYAFAPLEVTFCKADVRIKDQVAVTAMDQEFYNPNNQRLEGTFLFPVPKGAHLDKFTMEIGGKQVPAELLAADKAREIYEDILRKMRDPALLEYSGRDLFKVRIFPIESHSKKRITLSYTQVLKADAGLINFTLPLNTAKFSAQPLKNVAVKVELESKRALKSIYSPSHKVEIKRQGDHQATVGFEASDVTPDADFQLYFAQEEGEVGVSLMTHRDSGEDGYFLLLASPAMEAKKGAVVLKDVAFVLDTSGSMAGKKLDQARKALEFCVENLNDGDRFEVLRFSTEVEPLFDKLVEATKANRERAEKFVKDLKPIGGTALDAALRKALSSRPDTSERPYVVIFLTDGQPTVGVTDEDQILAGVNKVGGNTRVFCFGIGTDVNTHLLDKITEQTKAFSQYVLPDEDLEVKVSSFFTKIKDPVLANLKLTFPGDIRATQFYPNPLPNLYRGEQLVLVGRYSGQGSGKVTIEGTVNGEVRKFSESAVFPEQTDDHDFIPRLWATRRVGYLLDEIRLHGENKELKDEVTELARKYGIVTPYTAYLIIEDEKQRGIASNVQSLPQWGLNPEARQVAAEAYGRFRQDKAGDLAVAGAQSTLAFRMAEAPADALQTGQRVAQRYGTSLSSAQPQAGAGGRLVVTSPQAAPAAGPAAAVAQQARFISGRTFYQNGNQWIDSEVQKQANAKKVRVQFNSKEYFDLLAQSPKVQAWLALGQNVQFVFGETVYEVYE
jgi:Ca-activated chloride channel family protein